MTIAKPRRSCLYMPGANQRALEKAASLDADSLLLDLEDAVAPEQKAQARQLIVDTLNKKPYGYREVVVRINALDSEWGREDIAAVIACNPDAILLPKVDTAADIYAFDELLKNLVEQKLAETLPELWIMIETPLSILNIQEIVETSKSTPLTTLVMGTNDLAKELRITVSKDRNALQYALQSCVLAARAYELCSIDGVFNDFRDAEGLLSECEQGRALGFDGKSLIHPAQLETANRTFMPSPTEVEWAKAVVAAFDLPSNRGKGVVDVDGKMTELLHRDQAHYLLEMYQAIQQRR